ncbi:MAG: hypothetical protein IT311_12615 [Anaerolineales bacterium]|nr:hypothetical protein [Anaerolineales bacterium]MCZ2122683.1 hypothetical protein [Anaerolineales bacterium]
MAEFYKFLAEYEVLIYILLAIGALFSFRWLWRSWQDWQVAVYKLEKEFSTRRLGQAAAISILILIFFCFEFFMASFILPGLPAQAFLSTPTLDFISTPTGTLSSAMMTQFAVVPASTQGPNALGCTPKQVEITSPKPGEEVKGTIDLIGTANIPDFGFYKYEVAPLGSDVWATISADREMKVDQPLGRWDTTALTPGDYQIRLVVTDNQGTALPACVIPLRVVPNQ